MALDIDRVPLAGIWWRHVRHGLDPLMLPAPPNDGRWQRGTVLGGLYLAGDEDTLWAEWYRALAESGLPPAAWLPRDVWEVDVQIDGAADLSDEDRLRRVGLRPPEPGRHTWPPYQDVGEALADEGCPALFAPSAARPRGLVLCVFDRPGAYTLNTAGKPTVMENPPAPPRGMRT